MTRALVASFVAVLAAATAGCPHSGSGTDAATGSDGASTTDGGGGSTDAAPGTDASLPGTDAGGSGTACGGFTGMTCPATEYCNYPDDLCGAADGSGVCETRPTACTEELDPTCACDGMTYSNPCNAAAAGQDVSGLGGCLPPPGFFACGPEFCALDFEYCFHLLDDTGMPDLWTCEPAPTCVMTDCACVEPAAPCSGACEEGNDGSVTITCGGG